MKTWEKGGAHTWRQTRMSMEDAMECNGATYEG